MSHASNTEAGVASAPSSKRGEKSANSNSNKPNPKSPQQSTTNSPAVQVAPMTATEAISEDAAASEKRRKAAAAAARRRRRKINLSRRQQQQNSPRSVSHSRVFNGPSQSLGGSHQGEGASIPAETPANSSSAIKRIRSTVEGMAEVAIRWQKEEIVAIPTECTYEACISLRTLPSNSSAAAEQEDSLSTQLHSTITPPDWAYRIERLRQVALGSYNTTTTTDTTDAAATSAATTTSTLLSSPPAPYCWIPRTADCPLLHDCLPPHVYAMRNTNAPAQQQAQHPLAHRFNETHEVVQRLARLVWPGPVTMHVAVPEAAAIAAAQNNPSHNNNGAADKGLRSFWSLLTSNHQLQVHEGSNSETSALLSSCPYLTLRCPRHPLAVRVSQEHIKGSACNDNQEAKESASTTTTASARDAISVLVGFPIANNASNNTGSGSSSAFCVASQHVQTKYGQFLSSTSVGGHSLVNSTVSAVLDGEDQSELFAVPTCEYAEPWHTQVWIHGPSRTISLVTAAGSPSSAPATTTTATTRPGKNNGNSDDSLGLVGGFACTTTTTPLSETRLKAALRQRSPNRPQLAKAKERIIQAVLCRWKIVELSN